MRFLPFLFLLSSIASAQTLQVAVPSDVLGDYQRWLRDRDIAQVFSYSGDGVRRDVVEVALFMQALKLGCGAIDVEWVPVDSYPRTLALLREGGVHAAATSVWKEDVDTNETFLSSPLIADGQFFVAMFTALNHPIKIGAASDLQNISVVSSKHWSRDWTVLKSLPLASLQHVNDWPTMVRWVASGKADALLAPMTENETRLLTVGSVSLVPISNARFVLPGSRHFALAKHNNDVAKKLSVCVESGLSILRQKGAVERAYKDSGFWREDFMRWKVLNILE